jgi:hypothetical protein
MKCEFDDVQSFEQVFERQLAKGEAI